VVVMLKQLKYWILIISLILRHNEQSGGVNCLKTLSNNRLAIRSDDKTVKMWNTQNYECTSTLKGHSNLVKCLEYISNNRLVSGSRD
jgi:WD40 repeat protein